MKIKDICDIRNGILVKTKQEKREFHHHLILPKDLDDVYGIDYESLEKYEEVANIFKNKLLFGDILIENKAPFRIILIDFFPPEIGLIASSNFIILRRRMFMLDKNEYPSEVICTFLKSKNVRQLFKSYTESKKVINQEEIGELEIPIIPLEEQQKLKYEYTKFSAIKKEALKIKKFMDLQIREGDKKMQKLINRTIK